MKHPIYNTKHQQVGEIEDNIYYTQRDVKKGQVFYHFGNALALDVGIVKNLIRHNVKLVTILVVNFNNEPSFYCVSTINNFLIHSEEIDYDKRNTGVNFTGYGKQRRMAMQFWQKVHSIDEVKKLKFEEQLTL